MSNGESTGYTGALNAVMVSLGRIEGKLDSFDNRLRAVEEQQAAWREVVKLQEPESERWKQRIERQGDRITELENKRSLGEALKHYWYVVVIVALPAILNSAYVITKLMEARP